MSNSNLADILIDDTNRDLIENFNWSISDSGYLYARVKGKTQLRHRLIAERINLDLSNDIDHRDTNKANNQRNNLRSATKSQNGANSKISKSNTSGFKGVYQDKRDKKWVSRIRVNYKRIYLGAFDTPEAAYTAYCEAADKHFGEFANHG